MEVVNAVSEVCRRHYRESARLASKLEMLLDNLIMERGPQHDVQMAIFNRLAEVTTNNTLFPPSLPFPSPSYLLLPARSFLLTAQGTATDVDREDVWGSAVQHLWLSEAVTLPRGGKRRGGEGKGGEGREEGKEGEGSREGE